MLFAVLLIVSSIFPALLRVTGPVAFGGELFLGLLFLAVAIRFWRRRTSREARIMFIASIIYLPLALAVLVITKL